MKELGTDDQGRRVVLTEGEKMNPAQPEINAAARWWANQLRDRPAHDNGDRSDSALATAFAQVLARPTEAQIEQFENALREVLVSRYTQRPDDWRPTQPDWGSALRTVSTDYHPDTYLSQAATAAGFDAAYLLPIKTIMWVDPGQVRVRHGYGAETVLVWRAEQMLAPVAG